MNYLGNVMESFTSDVLSSIGLQRRATTTELLIPAVGGLAVGILVGGAAALLLAPTTGAELRAKLSDQLADARERAREAADTMREKVKRTTANASNAGSEVARGTRSDA